MFTLLKSEVDWATYRNSLTGHFSVPGSRIRWGKDPAEYPCLVSTLIPDRQAGTDATAYSAFVYVADCEELFKAANRRTVDPDAAPIPNQRQFNRWVAAELMTIAHFLVETRICKPEQFETKLLEMLESVDAYHKQDVDELKKRLASYDANILDMLGEK